MKPHTLKLFLLLVLVQVTACDTQPVKPEQETGITTVAGSTETATAAEQASLSEEAEKLLLLAQQSNDEAEQFRYRALAARLYIEAGEIELAQSQLYLLQDKQQNRPATDKTQAETEAASVLLLTTELAIKDRNTTLANQLIHQVKAISRVQQIYYYELKADLDVLSGKFMHAVDRRVQLDSYITETKAKNRNNRKIWGALSNLSSIQLNNQRGNNATINGWLALAKVVRTGQNNISRFEDSLLDWGTNHPTHPANDNFLAELISIYQADTTTTKHIAVILPMQGDLAKITDNIKNGILSAYYSDTDNVLKPIIRFYDSSDASTSFNQLYQQAIDNGASNIIGPLNKVVINQLAQQHALDIPVLTLNYAQSAYNSTDNLFQFGLSPEDEARQVAELAIKQNKKRAAVFFAGSDWGKRLSQAFREHYTALGGKVVSMADYATNTNDFSRPIRALFNLDQSSIRHRKVENTISKRAYSIAYRRQDIDMIFLAATHRSARSIMPAFRFHHASNLPVYSTSHVYTGQINRELDRDLNGLVFCDLPWILQNTSPLQQTFKQNWPQQKNFTRLFALGVDAYHLLYNLDYLKHTDFAFYDGQTGNIRLDENNRITRQLLWAKFERGKPVYFEPTMVEPTLTKSSNQTGVQTEVRDKLVSDP